MNGSDNAPVLGAYGVVKNFGHVCALRHASIERIPLDAVTTALPPGWYESYGG
jgi:hypothetical protein